LVLLKASIAGRTFCLCSWSTPFLPAMVGTEMLAAAAVSQVARKIGEIIGAAQGEVTLCCSFSDDLESIKDTLVYLEDLLKNAERNSFGSERANLRHWLAQIKSLAFDIEDMVDDYYSSKEQFEGSSSYAQKGSLFCSLSNPVISKVSMVHKMKSKRELLQTRQHLPNQYHFISHINSVVDFDEKQTTSYRNSDITLFGRDRDLENLMNMIMQKSVGEISIISIVGPMGLGKTSLAQLVFNDARTKAFSFRIWVHVSMGNVSLEKIGRDIVSQTTERIEGNMQLQLIKNAVRTILNKYSCLIVLDSLWGKDEEVNELKQMLLTGIQTESKIVVTTHSYKVAELVSTVPPYKLSALSEDDCLNIFSQRAMAGRGDPLFREYGEEIVRRCGGTPLVANFLGSVVNAQRQRREIWKAAKDKEMWKIEEDYPEDKISPLFPSFKIIYYNMPHELRLCFVYCSIFPKGSVIDKKKLIQQWIALDMIESRHGTLPHDVTAEKYIDELKAIYFLQVIERHQVRLSIVTSEIIPEAPVIGDLKGKKKLASASGLDVVPEVVTKPNETGDTPLIPGRPFSLSSSHSSSFASSSRAPLAYVSSSDVSKNNNLVPNGEITGTQFNEKCQEPQDLIKDVLITEENICSLDTPVHVHELATVEGDDDGHVIKYNGVYQHSVLCDRPNQGVVVQQSN
uniref:NB-ARC domain-containing protein n=1 Tax=Aegilops tauschii subsp. strangulata TaxID=200361 RepID=A0A453KMG5_AEGTS